MIDSTSSFDRTSRPQPTSDDSAGTGASSLSRARDRLFLDTAGQISAALAGQSDIRPESVARGRELAADPAYPPASVLSQVAAAILASPDLSEAGE